jgi:hypothetical protein
MAIMQREFFSSPRGPAPSDEDTWRLVFDASAGRVLVRHLWQTSRDSGYRDTDIGEFLSQAGATQGAAHDALIELLFGRVVALA